jgi:hypothetical protein
LMQRLRMRVTPRISCARFPNRRKSQARWYASGGQGAPCSPAGPTPTRYRNEDLFAPYIMQKYSLPPAKETSIFTSSWVFKGWGFRTPPER